MTAADSAKTKADKPQPGAIPREAMAMRSNRAIFLFLGVLIASLAADLIVKSVAFNHVADEAVILTRESSHVPEHAPIIVVPKVLALWLTANTGAVFGLGKGNQLFFVAISIIATVVIVRMFLRSDRKQWLMHVCLALILSGALGNLYDRVRFNAVRDMLVLFPDVHLPFGLSWPNGKTELYPWIFNIADVALVVGVLVLMVLIWRYDRQLRAAESAGS